jgi:hypothetical protein
MEKWQVEQNLRVVASCARTTKRALMRSPTHSPGQAS